MDDMWSTKAWDDFKSSFQDCENGSRIIVTTRLSDVAVYLGSRSPYFMKFLDEVKSWNLFCEKVFAHESCPPELEEPGKEIVKNCRGLPLTIVVIGGFLAKYDRIPIYWESVADNVKLYANTENDEQCSKILALSYQHLPIHLKLCFLYMRVFPEDHDIRVSELVNLWIAEGCLKALKAKNLEETAEEYLKDLIARNLISIRKQGRTGKIKICGIHDLLRDLCMKEFHRENLFSVPKVQHIELEPGWYKYACFLCHDGNTQDLIELTEVVHGHESSSYLRPWVCEACKIMHPHLKRLKVVREKLKFAKDPRVELLLPTTLRYLSLKDFGGLCSISFSSIRLLWNLQTLNIINFHKNIVLPSDIWEMPQLTQIKIKEGVLLDPLVDDEIEEEDCTILKNLHTLSNIKNFTLTKEVLARIPNLKKLRIFYSSSNSFHNLALLSKLESLYLEAGGIYSSYLIAFPHSLKKLELSCCGMDWEDMTIIGSLPNLEVLKLRSHAFSGYEWNPVEGEFLRLKLLLIGSTDLRRWGAEDYHFPCLETLVLRGIKSLEEIPSGIGDIGTLRSIELIGCNNYVIRSAEQIIEEQQSMGNEDLQLHVSAIQHG
ncbi:hypothetical protein BUALT_Bualt07G0029300 [Buddleja alternifolia]|uniref:NB-ARC domain-containing protein n=1 Tax=Buddleja alternifolia TaxID=168488 RepID=A0AAV6XE87_9LAMI|nr:hypothetical protein BUALT_Bualt07G0029300 [Buddleja alternifolia]